MRWGRTLHTLSRVTSNKEKETCARPPHIWGTHNCAISSSRNTQNNLVKQISKIDTSQNAMFLSIFSSDKKRTAQNTYIRANTFRANNSSQKILGKDISLRPKKSHFLSILRGTFCPYVRKITVL